MYEGEEYSEVIGVDNLIHIAYLSEDKTKCGMPIKKKNVTNHDTINKFHCAECDWDR